MGDRGNARVQVLDNNLNWKANYPNVGNPWAVCVSGGPGPKNPGKQYLNSSNSWQDSAPAAGAEFTGEVYKMELDGTIVGSSDAPARRLASSRPSIRWMPRPEHHLHRRDQQLAVAEDSAQDRDHHERAGGRCAMNRTWLVLGAAMAMTGAALVAQAPVPELAFDTNADFLRTPADTFVGEVGGVGANSKGQLFVYTRTGHPYATLGDNRTFFRNGSRLFQFDPNGKFVRELGQDVYGFNAAIGLRVDPQDNVWTIDAGANQVVKFDTEGRVALVLGRKPETMPVRPPPPPAAGAPAAGGPEGRIRRARRRRGAPAGEGIPGSTFFRPSDVAWDGPATSTSPTAWAPTTASRSSTRRAGSSASGARRVHSPASSAA